MTSKEFTIWSEVKDTQDKVNDKISFSYTSKVWNDKMGKWHYENYPEGFGYYTNSTLENKNKENE